MQNDSNNPSIQQPELQQPITTTVKRSKKKLFIFGGIGLAIVLIVMGFILIPRIIKSAELANLDTGLPYIYKPIMNNVEPTGKFTYDLGFAPERKKDDEGIDNYTDYIAVYSDAAFTKSAIDTLSVYTDTRGKKLAIVPSPSAGLTGAYDVSKNEKVSLATDRHWGIHETYYIVQYVDLNSGKKLKKPIVQPFTVKHELATPKVTYTLDDKGNISLKWDKVEGASKYYITRVERGAGDGANIYATVEDTKWSSESESKTRGYEGFIQNRIVSTINSQDKDAYQGEGSIDNDKKYKKQDNIDLAVIAATDDKVSSYQSLDTGSMRAKAPYSVATNTALALKIKVAGGIDSINDIPASVPVTLADGRTAMQAITIDKSAVRISEKGIFDSDVGKFLRTVDIPYTVDGTGLDGVYKATSFDDATYMQQLDNVIAANREKQVKTGAANFVALDESSLPTSNQAVSKTRPSVPYPVSASNPFSDYIAANLINGAELIDVSKYVNESQAITPEDAFYEATSQNPYALYVTGYYYSETKKIIQVRYGADKETRANNQKAISEKSKSIIGSVIKSGMNDEAKVKAINQYIVDNTKYDYKALSVKDSFLVADYADAWSAYGTLIDGTSVCGGYALGFQALALQAGLKSVYVTGYIDSTNRHAWNKVEVDGKWRIVDTTWNDSASNQNRYLLITDQQAESQRNQVEDPEWIADPYLKEYQAN